jgi:hypothetical protein
MVGMCSKNEYDAPPEQSFTSWFIVELKYSSSNILTISARVGMTRIYACGDRNICNASSVEEASILDIEVIHVIVLS